MAGDWMKIEHETPDKPEVLAIAAELEIHPDEAFGKCFRVWRWFDRQTENGNAASVTPALLERYLGVTGLCTAMQNVGWLVVENGSVSVPNFDRHNGVTAKTRALSARRQKTYKAGRSGKKTRKKGNAKGNAAGVTPSSLLFSSLLSSSKEIGDCLKCDEFGEAWDEWVQHRVEIKKPLTPTSVRNQLRTFTGWGCKRSVDAIRYTIEKGWQGIREPDERPLFGNGQRDTRTVKELLGES